MRGADYRCVLTDASSVRPSVKTIMLDNILHPACAPRQIPDYLRTHLPSTAGYPQIPCQGAITPTPDRAIAAVVFLYCSHSMPPPQPTYHWNGRSVSSPGHFIVNCWKCRVLTGLDADRLRQRPGDWLTVKASRQRLRCNGCGSPPEWVEAADGVDGTALGRPISRMRWGVKNRRRGVIPRWQMPPAVVLPAPRIWPD